MNWQLGSVRIFTQNYDEDDKQIIARLQPVNGATVMQVFGYETMVSHIAAIIVGLTDKNTLESYSRDGVSHTLSSPIGSLGDYFVSSIRSKWQQGICQTLRPDLDTDAPVFTVDIELFKEE